MWVQSNKNIKKLPEIVALFVHGLQDYNSFIREMEDRRAGANNIMLYNLNKENKDGNDELPAVRKILADVLPSQENIVKVFRVGASNNNKPRPLKVILSSSDLALKLVKNPELSTKL